MDEQHENSIKRYWLCILAFFLLFVVLFLLYLDWQNSHKVFTFAMLDVGQGDSFFIESPTGTQIMFDGGPVRKVLGPLQKIISPFDKDINILIITNPDADHLGGFLDILKNYKVGMVLEPGTLTDSRIYQNLKDEIKKQQIPNILAKKGMQIDMGGGVFIDILFPDRNVATWATNDGSIVARLTYGNISIMLTGDVGMMTEKVVLSENLPSQLKSTILKVGHHGSRTSTSQEFVKAVSPQYALISVGKENSYGHPHPETLNILTGLNIKILRTDLLGSIILKCATIEKCAIN